MTKQLAFALPPAEAAVTPAAETRQAEGAAQPDRAPQAPQNAAVGLLCVACGAGPVRPGERCGWCSKRAKGEGR